MVLNQFWSRHDRMVDAGSATFLEILDDTERDTVNLCLQNAALVADDAWEQTARGHYGLSQPSGHLLITDVERAEEDGNEECSYVPARGTRLSEPELHNCRPG